MSTTAAAPPPAPHFLIITYAAQGHINPARHLARCLIRAAAGAARVTFSTSVSGHRKLFPGSPTHGQAAVVDSDGISYIPYSDGYDDGYDRSDRDVAREYGSRSKLAGSRTLSGILTRLAADGCPVTCVIYNFLLPWVPAVAREHGTPSALYWIQPAAVLAVYYYYFHGHRDAIVSAAGDPMAAVTLPGLPTLRVRDLPSFVTVTSPGHIHNFVIERLRDLYDALEAEATKPTVLANTFGELEREALSAVPSLNVIPIGPLLSFLSGGGGGTKADDLFKQEEEINYMEWLDTKADRSVVYISFGSLAVMSCKQMGAVLGAMRAIKKPFLWVVRKDNRKGEEEQALLRSVEDDDGGMVVEWCKQVEVLRHRAVGCFVTHCGWNSTLETMASGVPAVCVPQWSDQGTNAWILSRLGTGVRCAADGAGEVEAAELGRCVEMVMGEGSAAAAMAVEWAGKARTAVGSSERNLKDFVDSLRLP